VMVNHLDTGLEETGKRIPEVLTAAQTLKNMMDDIKNDQLKEIMKHEQETKEQFLKLDSVTENCSLVLTSMESIKRSLDGLKDNMNENDDNKEMLSKVDGQVSLLGEMKTNLETMSVQLEIKIDEISTNFNQIETNQESQVQQLIKAVEKIAEESNKTKAIVNQLPDLLRGAVKKEASQVLAPIIQNQLMNKPMATPINRISRYEAPKSGLKNVPLSLPRLPSRGPIIPMLAPMQMAPNSPSSPISPMRKAISARSTGCRRAPLPLPRMMTNNAAGDHVVPNMEEDVDAMEEDDNTFAEDPDDNVFVFEVIPVSDDSSEED